MKANQTIDRENTLYNYIHSNCDEAGKLIVANQELIEKFNISRDTLYRWIRVLKAKNLLEAYTKHIDGSNKLVLILTDYESIEVRIEKLRAELNRRLDELLLEIKNKGE